MWDERYGQDGFAYGSEPNDFLVEVVELIPQGRVLCLAEGEGRNAVFLAKRGYEVTGVDGSAVGLAKAQQLAADAGVSIHTEVADLAEFQPEPEAYQGIVSIWAHVPPDLRRALHRKCVAALAPSGIFVLEAYSPAQVGRGTGGPKTTERTMSVADLRSELAGLEVLRAQELERDVREGKYHQGMSAVTHFVARKPHA